jgi:hypothetical protein
LTPIKRLAEHEQRVAMSSRRPNLTLALALVALAMLALIFLAERAWPL